MSSLSTEPDPLLFLPLGGSGEIGMNLNLYGLDGKWLMVDLGVTFGEPQYPGVDLVFPDPRFIEERREDLLALILTHAHEDHYGAVAALWPRLRCPVYATPFTAELLRGKLIEAGILDEVPIHIVQLSEHISVGPFDIEFFSLTHSIPEPNALVIRTRLGTVLHTGDWKFDPDPQIGPPTDEKALAAIGREGVRAIVCDSTNVFNPGRSGSEGAVRDSLEMLLENRKGRIAVTTFASNLARVATLAKVAALHDRHVVLVGRSLHRAVAAARDTGYLADCPPFLDEKEVGYIPPEKLLFICTGSQGEPRGAMSRIATGEHKDVGLEAGDTVVFSSKIIPGNELSLAHLHNALVARGIEVITEKREFVHVSGHPSREELTEMYEWVRPEVAVPVHGEIRHLEEHGRLAASLGVKEVVVPRNGTVVQLVPGPARIVDHVPVGRLVMDGTVLIAADGLPIVERRRLQYNGAVFVSLLVNAEGILQGMPEVMAIGVPATTPETLEDDIAAAVAAAVGAMPQARRRDGAAIAEEARIAARRWCRDKTSKRPVTEVALHFAPLEK
jgi:ribonuclease J